MKTPSPSPKNTRIGRGEAFFDRFDANGVRTGESSFGNCTSCTLQFDASKEQAKNNLDDTGGVYDEAVTGVVGTLVIETQEFASATRALAVLGVEAKLAQASGTVTAEPLAAAPLAGRWYVTKKRQISSVVVKQGANTMVLYDAATGLGDYKIDAVSGRIYVVPTGAIDPAVALTVDYAAGVLDLDVILPGIAGTIQGAFRYKGKNVRGTQTELEVWRTSATPGGEVPLITESYGSYRISLTVLADRDAHPAEPYGREIELP